MKIKKIIISLIFVFSIFQIALFFNTFLTFDEVQAQEVDTGYKITAYDININVGENNVYNINETITVNYLVSRHGIIRNIPTLYSVVRADNTKAKQYSKISKMKISMDGLPTKFLLTKNSNNYAYKIGDEDKFLNGQHVYTLNYDFNYGKDLLKNGDEFYFNLIGTQWTTSIENVTFSVTMPKEFSYNEETLGFSHGAYGSRNSSDVSYLVNGNTIEGSLATKLEAGEGLTMRLVLPQGYFVGATDNFENKFVSISIYVAISILIVASIIFFILKSTHHVVTPISFYAPHDKGPLDIAMDYKLKVRTEDVTALVFSLANKGFIDIIDIDGKNFKFSMVKQYTGDDKDEKDLFYALFNGGIRKSVSIADLKQENFYLTPKAICKDRNKAENKKRYLKKSNNLAKLFFGICIAIVLFFELMICADVGYVLETTLIVVALVTFVFSVSSFSINGEFKLFTILSVVVIAFNLIFVLFGRAYFNYKFIIACLVCLLVSLILIYMSKKTTIRSKYGDKVYGEALGFREFLLRAEKDKLEKLVEENPKYYYDILPYVYVLNVSDKWVKKFEGINMPQPDWYVGTSFSLYTFNHSMSRMSSLTAHAMSSSSKSSSDFGGGGFSGGGFSGGGGGGGGGSSW